MGLFPIFPRKDVSPFGAGSAQLSFVPGNEFLALAPLPDAYSRSRALVFFVRLDKVQVIFVQKRLQL